MSNEIKNDQGEQIEQIEGEEEVELEVKRLKTNVKAGLLSADASADSSCWRCPSSTSGSTISCVY